MKFTHLLMLISDDFQLKVLEIAKRVPRVLADVHKDEQTFINITIQS